MAFIAIIIFSFSIAFFYCWCLYFVVNYVKNLKKIQHQTLHFKTIHLPVPIKTFSPHSNLMAKTIQYGLNMCARFWREKESSVTWLNQCWVKIIPGLPLVMKRTQQSCPNYRTWCNPKSLEHVCFRPHQRKYGRKWNRPTPFIKK